MSKKAVPDPEELERMHEHTRKHPAFVGDLEFDMTIVILGKRVKRR